ncbi:P27 family phage terminase small subunit [Salinicoccus roseus]|uniref:P27 family phage terminase small subunit n=1 Tax=Salinicoccus roseus TaxID=45670 RepID=UPI002301BF99|nr:P27 family phage terminase small subunit [Salinicoccus roseus]
MPSNTNLEDLRKYLINQLGEDNRLHVDKVERYISLLKLFHEIDEDIENQKRMVVTENGAQRFVKPHPGIEQKIKINKELLSIEESFGFHRKLKDKEEERPTKKRKGGLLDST